MEKSQRTCPKCWQPYTIGHSHICEPRAAVKPQQEPALVAPVKNAVKNSVKNAPIDVKNAKAKPATPAARARKWREAHREESRRYMREYMRNRRREEALRRVRAI